jgi:multidrug efflux pump subunit AcrB
MTTIGTEEGRNHARVNLKLVDRDGAFVHREPERRSEELRRSPGRACAGLGLPVGERRPRSRMMTRIGESPTGREDPGSPTSRLGKAAARAAIRLNNDVAADLGITQQVGATVRPLLAGDTVSYWLGPDGQNYEVNVKLAKDNRRMASDLGNLYLTSTKRGPDGQMRMVPLRQVAELVETTSPQIIKRQDLQRRVSVSRTWSGVRPATPAATSRRSSRR